MDHRWDDSNRQDHAARGEHERYGARRIEDDPDVERRDRLREAERLASINQSPWSIGVSHWDQRDLYTRNNRIDEEGYGRGPSMHPERGSYAYPRQARNPGHPVQQRPEYEASLHEREAWPWLNYHDVKDHPSFAHLSHEEKHGIWTRLKDGVAGLLHVGSHASHGKAAPKNAARPDARLMEDVSDALTYRHRGHRARRRGHPRRNRDRPSIQAHRRGGLRGRPWCARRPQPAHDPEGRPHRRERRVRAPARNARHLKGSPRTLVDGAKAWTTHRSRAA